MAILHKSVETVEHLLNLKKYSAKEKKMSLALPWLVIELHDERIQAFTLMNSSWGFSLLVNQRLQSSFHRLRTAIFPGKFCEISITFCNFACRSVSRIFCSLLSGITLSSGTSTLLEATREADKASVERHFGKVYGFGGAERRPCLLKVVMGPNH